MATVWGFALVVVSLVAWLGQVISWRAPSAAVRAGLMEASEDVEPVYAADIRGEAIWDSLTLWTMPVAGVLLTLDHDWWTYFGLVGGGMYVYFAGRGLVTRRVMRSSGYRVGQQSNVTAAFVLLTVWGVMAVATIAAAVNTLDG